MQITINYLEEIIRKLSSDEQNFSSEDKEFLNGMMESSRPLVYSGSINEVEAFKKSAITSTREFLDTFDYDIHEVDRTYEHVDIPPNLSAMYQYMVASLPPIFGITIPRGIIARMAVFCKDTNTADRLLEEVRQVPFEKLMSFCRLPDYIYNFLTLPSDIQIFYQGIVSASEEPMKQIQEVVIRAVAFEINPEECGESLSEAIENYQYPAFPLPEGVILPEGFVERLYGMAKKYVFPVNYIREIFFKEIHQFCTENKLEEVLEVGLYNLGKIHSRAKSNMTFLQKGDPLGYFIGKYTNSCMYKGGHSETKIVTPFYTSPWSGYLVVYKGSASPGNIQGAAYACMVSDENGNSAGLVLNSYCFVESGRKDFIPFITSISKILYNKGLKLYLVKYRDEGEINFTIKKTDETLEYKMLPTMPHPKPTMDPDVPIYEEALRVAEIPIGEDIKYDISVSLEPEFNMELDARIISMLKFAMNTAMEFLDKYNLTLCFDIMKCDPNIIIEVLSTLRLMLEERKIKSDIPWTLQDISMLEESLVSGEGLEVALNQLIDRSFVSIDDSDSSTLSLIGDVTEGVVGE